MYVFQSNVLIIYLYRYLKHSAKEEIRYICPMNMLIMLEHNVLIYCYLLTTLIYISVTSRAFWAEKD